MPRKRLRWAGFHTRRVSRPDMEPSHLKLEILHHGLASIVNNIQCTPVERERY
jgi:hypothetical protein